MYTAQVRSIYYHFLSVRHHGVQNWILVKFADELIRQGFKITDDTVGHVITSLVYSLQGQPKKKGSSEISGNYAQKCPKLGSQLPFISEEAYNVRHAG